MPIAQWSSLAVLLSSVVKGIVGASGGALQSFYLDCIAQQGFRRSRRCAWRAMSLVVQPRDREKTRSHEASSASRLCTVMTCDVCSRAPA